MESNLGTKPYAATPSVWLRCGRRADQGRIILIAEALGTLYIRVCLRQVAPIHLRLRTVPLLEPLVSFLEMPVTQKSSVRAERRRVLETTGDVNECHRNGPQATYWTLEDQMPLLKTVTRLGEYG